MIWDIVLYVAAAALLLTLILRLTSKSSSESSGKSGNIVTRGTALPTVLVVLLLLALIFKFEPRFLGFGPSWTDEDREQVESFNVALEHYETASLAKLTMEPHGAEWESVKAMLEAASYEMSMVSDDVLGRIHSDLPQHVSEEFLPGLRMGLYGLDYYMNRRSMVNQAKPDSVRETSYDSLDNGRALLTNWNAWYDANREHVEKMVR